MEHTDLNLAMASLKDEISGIAQYEEQLKLVICPELKAVFEHNITVEKDHAKALLSWMHKLLS